MANHQIQRPMATSSSPRRTLVSEPRPNQSQQSHRSILHQGYSGPRTISVSAPPLAAQLEPDQHPLTNIAVKIQQPPTASSAAGAPADLHPTVNSETQQGGNEVGHARSAIFGRRSVSTPHQQVTA
ncbi:hypothetical protein ACLOJK_023107 [Asimina triloba]